jgi:peptidoglycan hydrolase-like protein with peptidoglycan-binding domain
MAKKRKKAAEESINANPLAVVQWGTASVFSALIIYNAFFGQTTRLPDGATTHVEVEAPAAKTITIRYDAKVEDAQRQLLATGHYKGLVDGIVGNRTRVAVEAYQKQHDLAVTGDVTEELLEHIRYTRKVEQAADITGSTTEVEAAVEEVIPQAKILRMQKLLVSLGYGLGDVDGQLSGPTRAAIRAFETDQKLETTGEYSDALMKKLIEARSSAANNG